MNAHYAWNSRLASACPTAVETSAWLVDRCQILSSTRVV